MQSIAIYYSNIENIDDANWYKTRTL